MPNTKNKNKDKDKLKSINNKIENYFNNLCNLNNFYFTYLRRNEFISSYDIAKFLSLEVEVVEEFLLNPQSLKINNKDLYNLIVDKTDKNNILSSDFEFSILIKLNKSISHYIEELIVSNPDIKKSDVSEIEYTLNNYYNCNYVLKCSDYDINDIFDYRKDKNLKGLSDIYNDTYVKLNDLISNNYVLKDDFDYNLNSESYFWIYLRQLSNLSYDEIIFKFNNYLSILGYDKEFTFTKNHIIYLEYGKGVNNPKRGLRSHYFNFLKRYICDLGLVALPSDIEIYELKNIFIINNYLVSKKFLFNWIFDNYVNNSKDLKLKLNNINYYKVNLNFNKN